MLPFIHPVVDDGIDTAVGHGEPVECKEHVLCVPFLPLNYDIQSMKHETLPSLSEDGSKSRWSRSDTGASTQRILLQLVRTSSRSKYHLFQQVNKSYWQFHKLYILYRCHILNIRKIFWVQYTHKKKMGLEFQAQFGGFRNSNLKIICI